MNSNTTIKPLPGVIWRTLDDETVLIIPETGHYVIINAIGTFVWGLVSQNEGLSVKEIERRMMENYAVAPELASSVLNNFLSNLQQKGLIQWEPSP